MGAGVMHLSTHLSTHLEEGREERYSAGVPVIPQRISTEDFAIQRGKLDQHLARRMPQLPQLPPQGTQGTQGTSFKVPLR